MKSKLILFTLLTFLQMNIFSVGQTEEADYREVSGKENWEYEVPISEKEPGVYNLLIRAKDKANNESFAGPYDIVVDPESDLPIVSITNPSLFMRVGGDLNIVGTARDDDKVAKVLIKIDDGEYFEANGQEFWNYLLESSLLEDGQHRIFAKAVDINGVEGYETSIIYNQDTLKPKNSITNYENGAIFSDKVTILGQIEDANGIANLSYSRDNQETFNNLKFRESEEGNYYDFEIELDTKKMEDGPNIYWFKSKDKTGSFSYTPFLFFVDNKGPEITVIDPLPTDELNGHVTISGKIYDKIGINSFKFIYGDLTGDIELFDGNPYWSTTLDFSEEDKLAELILQAEDSSGNITAYELEVIINNEIDRPILDIYSPVEGVTYSDEVILEGSIIDDDKISEIGYSIDGGDFIYSTTEQNFSFLIGDLKSGEHSLEVITKDSYNRESIPVELNFIIEKTTFNINFTEVSGEEYYPGISVIRDGDLTLSGHIINNNIIESSRFRVAGGEYQDLSIKRDEEGHYQFQIDIDESITYGVSEIEVEVTDNFGRSITHIATLNVKNYKINNDEWGVYHSALPESGIITLHNDSPFEMLFHGPDIYSVVTETTNDNIEVSFKGQIITISPRNIAKSEAVTFNIESEKGLFKTKAFDFIFDNRDPVITLNSPVSGEEGSGILKLSGEIEEDFPGKLYYRFSNSTDFIEIPAGGNSFNTSIELPIITTESLGLEVKAVDNLGNSSSVFRTILLKDNTYVSELTPEEKELNAGKSSDKPVIEVNFPVRGQLFHNEPQLSGFTRDDESVKELVISEAVEGGKSQTFSVTDIFEIPLTEFGSGVKKLNIKAIDELGVESKSYSISYRYEPGSSTVSLDRDSTSGAFITSEKGATITGSINNPYGGSVTYSIDGSEYKKAVFVDETYTITLNNPLSWGKHSIDILYRDEFDRENILSSFFYIVDKTDSRDILDEDGIYIKKEADDRVDGFFIGRDITSVSLESEKGSLPSFLKAGFDSDKVWIESLQSGIAEGVRLVVTTIDGDEYRSDFYNFISDSIDPVLSLEYEENHFIKTKYTLKGVIRDNLRVGGVRYSLNRGVNWESITLEQPLREAKDEKYTATHDIDFKSITKVEMKELIFSEEIDFSNLKDGAYTIYIEAFDEFNNIISEKINIVKDNTNPDLVMFIPGTDEINGIISLMGKSSDNIELDNVSYSIDGLEFYEINSGGVFSFDIDFSDYELFPETFVVRSTDRAGNRMELFPKLNINQLQDIPQVEIQTPVEGEVIRNDFVISGMAFDDDKIAEIYYSLDGSEFIAVAKESNNFSLDIPLLSVADNEHIIRVKAVDILGIESEVVESSFWVSREEPTSSLNLPKIEETKSGTIQLSGVSSDENGIKEVYISTDNGVSYQKAIGTTDWSYTFNSNNIKDGTYSIFVKAVDKLNTEGFYSTLMNIDNTAPELIINRPLDGEILSDKINFSGRSRDNLNINRVNYRIYSHLESDTDSLLIESGTLANGGIFNIDIPLEGYTEGEYNIELIAYDYAENRSVLSRNFKVSHGVDAGDLEILFPQSGSSHTGEFEVAGKVTGHKKVRYVECYIDNSLYTEIPVNEFNYFNSKLNSLNLEEGEHNISFKATLEDGEIYQTANRLFSVKSRGAWISIDNIKTGDNLSGRPYMRGESGFFDPDRGEEEESIHAEKVEVSLDNGQIFELATGTDEWEYRIETWQYEDGLTPILVRATFPGGDIVTRRLSVNFDRSTPDISVIEDLDKGHFNESIKLTGSAFDSNGLTDISVILRDGSKSNYEIPGLFQGMFIDMEAGYGKVYAVGMGLTFFDDNVKLQGTYGETRVASEDARIKGSFYGLKLLANLYTLEFGGLLGPDWDFFSMSVGVGASFTNKTLVIQDEESDLWYSAMVAQAEIAKFKFDNTYISSLAIFIDFESTLISSENEGGFYSRLGLGTRVTLF